MGNFANFNSSSSPGSNQSSQEVSIHATAVGNLIVAVANKPGDPDTPSFMHGFARAVAKDESLKVKWNIMDLYCLSHDGEEIVKVDGYPWKIALGYVEEETDEALTAFGKHIASEWTIAAKNVQKFADKFKLDRINTTARKPLNQWIRNSDCVKILASCYDDSREELMEDEDLMQSYFGDAETGKEILEGIDDKEWK